MTAPEQDAQRDTLTEDIAALLAEHWEYEPTADYDAWECSCGVRISDTSEGALDEDMRAHVAALLADRLAAAQAEHAALAERYERLAARLDAYMYRDYRAALEVRGEDHP